MVDGFCFINPKPCWYFVVTKLYSGVWAPCVSESFCTQVEVKTVHDSQLQCVCPTPRTAEIIWRRTIQLARYVARMEAMTSDKNKFWRVHSFYFSCSWISDSWISSTNTDGILNTPHTTYFNICSCFFFSSLFTVDQDFHLVSPVSDLLHILAACLLYLRCNHVIIELHFYVKALLILPDLSHSFSTSADLLQCLLYKISVNSVR